MWSRIATPSRIVQLPADSSAISLLVTSGGCWQYFRRDFESEDSPYRRARGALWRLWMKEWVWAARYVSARELMLPYLMVGTVSERSGEVYEKTMEEVLSLDRKVRRPSGSVAVSGWTFPALLPSSRGWRESSGAEVS